MLILRDDYGNSAVIRKIECLPYIGAPQRTEGYQLTCHADYDGARVYFLSLYDSKEAALKKLSSFSGGTFQ